ncbi:MAG: radical SAM protein [Candidatus Methanoperedens sp.]|nr:radical SAM protein [Candidatus Methanoperedens sp.]
MYRDSRYNKFFRENDSIFLFNSFSRACIKVKRTELKRIKSILNEKNPCIGENKNYQDILIKNGFILSDNINELERIEYLYNANYFRTDEINVVLVPTFKCNFKCPYCFEAGYEKEDDEVKDYFDILRNFANENFCNRKRVHISLFGGEPLLKKNELFSYLDYVSMQSKNYGYDLSINIVTNGFLLDKDTVSALFKYNCISLQVTLDGNKEVHNKLRILHNNRVTFDIIVNNFKAAIQYGIKTHTNTHFILRVNLLNQNIDHIRPILESFNLEERGKINIIFRPIYTTSHFGEANSNTIFDLKKFYDEAKNYGFNIVKSTYYLQHCESAGGVNFFYVTPDLKIWKCLNDISTETANIGQINKAGMLQFNITHISKWYQKSNPFKDEKCRDCYYLPICYGGCTRYYAKTGVRKCTSKDMSITPYFYS